MKKLTNHTPGARGVNLTDGTTRWLEPGETVELDPKSIVGDVPDLGKPGESRASDDEALNGLAAENDALRAQVADLTKERDALKAQVAKFDPDGDGKAGGSKPKAG